MKKIFKGLALGIMTTAFAAVPAFAQTDECTPLYEQYTKNYKGTLEQRKLAVQGGEQYIAKCNVAGNEEQIKYLTPKVPALKAAIEKEEAEKMFNEAIKDPKTVNAENAFSSGKRILALNPSYAVDVMLVLASIGYDKTSANPPVDTYNADTITYSKQAIQKIESGATSKDWGAYSYNYKTKDPAQSKDNALSWMNYNIGYIMHNRQNMKKEALPYLYKSTQYSAGTKTNPVVYQTIGDYYKEEYNRLDDERTKLAKEAEGKTPEEQKVLADKVKELLALQKGYADRMIDAYARARNNAGTDQAYKDSLNNTLKVLYGFRTGKQDGMDPYITGMTSKPMPDPTTAVTPVVETTPATTSATTSSSTISPTAPSTTANTARPATTNGTTPATTNGTTKTPAKKPAAAPKKKGTR